jgi:hypothetical protein
VLSSDDGPLTSGVVMRRLYMLKMVGLEFKFKHRHGAHNVGANSLSFASLDTGGPKFICDRCNGY